MQLYEYMCTCIWIHCICPWQFADCSSNVNFYELSVFEVRYDRVATAYLPKYLVNYFIYCISSIISMHELSLFRVLCICKYLKTCIFEEIENFMERQVIKFNVSLIKTILNKKCKYSVTFYVSYSFNVQPNYVFYICQIFLKTNRVF